jgi:hypothetical protein
MPVVVNVGDIVELKDETFVKVLSLPSDNTINSVYTGAVFTKKLEPNKRKLKATYVFWHCDIARVIDPNKVIPTYECTHTQYCVSCDWEGNKPLLYGVIKVPGMQAMVLRCPWCGSNVKERN